MNLLIVDDEIVTTQVLEEQLDRALLSIDQIYVAYNTSMAVSYTHLTLPTILRV